jgi:phosphate transport system protein
LLTDRHEGPEQSRRSPRAGAGPRAQVALWSHVQGMAAAAIDAFSSSVRALRDGDEELARTIRRADESIDRGETNLERECLRILALYDPVATDLRRVVAALRIARELERLGDLAVHIAARASKLARRTPLQPIPPALDLLATTSLAILEEVRVLIEHADTGRAHALLAEDRRIDAMRDAAQKGLKTMIRAEPERIDTWLRLMNTVRNLERAADHATNIAESLIYLAEGAIARRAQARPFPGRGVPKSAEFDDRGVEPQNDD